MFPARRSDHGRRAPETDKAGPKRPRSIAQTGTRRRGQRRAGQATRSPKGNDMNIPTKTGVGLTATLLGAVLAASGGPPAQAYTVNDNIRISEGALKGKCRRSGGKFTVEADGTYFCVVENGDSTTVVTCKKRKCSGIIARETPGLNRQPIAPATGGGVATGR